MGEGEHGRARSGAKRWRILFSEKIYRYVELGGGGAETGPAGAVNSPGKGMRSRHKLDTSNGLGKKEEAHPGLQVGRKKKKSCVT